MNKQLEIGDRVIVNDFGKESIGTVIGFPTPAAITGGNSNAVYLEVLSAPDEHGCVDAHVTSYNREDLTPALSREEYLAAQLITIYWLGAGDAGYDRYVSAADDRIKMTNAEAANILDQAKDITIAPRSSSNSIPLTKHFTNIAKSIIQNIG